MTVHVLCPGPSLVSYKPGDSIRIGVNRAVLHCKCDWWSALDYPFLKEYDAGYSIKLFTHDCTKLHRTERFSEVFHLESIHDHFPPKECVWNQYSATAALVLAAHLRASQIDVWGVDWAGVADWDGHEYSRYGEEARRTRGGAKWNGQIAAWNSTVDWLAKKGTNVTRHGIA